MNALPGMLAALTLLGAGVVGAGSSPTGAGVRMGMLEGPTTESSENWAGYAVTAAPGATTSFRAVSGTWVQPAAACPKEGPTYSGFWVGLGGFVLDSRVLEQIGTSSDCTKAGTPKYSAWYELIPAPPIPIKLRVAPGDTMSAIVAVSGSSVTLRLRNLTRRAVFTKKVTLPDPDLTSAEWVAEAPSSCDGWGRCQTQTLTNFGTVTFSGAAASTVDGQGGTISNPAWAVTSIRLFSRSPVRIDPRTGEVQMDPEDQLPGAVPSELSPDGDGFSVTWRGERGSAGG